MGWQVAACRGQEGDATPFTEVTVENISEELTRLGYHSRGWEPMYNGHTGRQMKVRLICCPAAGLAAMPCACLDPWVLGADKPAQLNFHAAMGP